MSVDQATPRHPAHDAGRPSSSAGVRSGSRSGRCRTPGQARCSSRSRPSGLRSDVHYYREGRIGDFVVDQPLVLGHEVSGDIVAVGAGVGTPGSGSAWRSNRSDRAACVRSVRPGATTCARAWFYATPPVDGAFCDYVTIQAEFAHRVPDEVSYDVAALLEPLSVGIWASRKAHVVPGSRILVAGAGPSA